MHPLSFYEALHLVKMETDKGEALELISRLAANSQITPQIEIKLKDWVSIFLN
jgi:hypothetical protein